MTYLLKYSPFAIQTFKEISAQLNDRWGNKYVAEFKKRTVKVIETIRISPFLYQSIESNSNVRKGFIHKNCSVFYKVKETKIEILFFWDNRQDPML